MAASQPLSASGGQNALAGGVLPFALEDGTTGIISPEEKRTFDHIINVNVGGFPLHGLTDTQAKHILSRSRLSEADLDSIWGLTDTIVAEGFPDGCWTQLEVYVVLHFVQAQELLSLNEMAIQFAGSTPTQISKKIKRRSSYAQAGISLSPRFADEIPAMPPDLGRNLSLPLSLKPPEGSTLRHTASDSTTTTAVRRFRSNQAPYRQDSFSVGQAGLEAIDTIEELREYEPQNPVPALKTASRNAKNASTFDRRHGMGTSLRESVMTDTAGRAQRLETLTTARCPEISIEPDIENPEYRQMEASIVDRTEAREILVRVHRDNPVFKDPSSGLVKFMKSKQANEKASNTQTWKFTEEDLSNALREVVEVSGRVGVAKELIDMGANVNFQKRLRRHKFKAFRSDDFESIPFNYIKISASKKNAEMVSHLASRGVSLANLVEALEQAVRQNLPDIVLVLLQHGADPNACDGAIFDSAIASQKPILVRLLLRSQIKVQRCFLNRSLPVAVSQGQVEIVSLLIVYGADVNYEHASALRIAVRAQRVDLILYIMKGHVTSEAASSVIEKSFSASSSLAVLEQYLIVEILLCAGARGDPVAKTLISVVRSGHRSIVKLLVMHGADLEYNNAEALRMAVAAADEKILVTLLLGKLHRERASNLFDGIPLNCNDDQMYGLMSALISKGATGEPLNKALVQAVQRKSVRVIGLLLNHKASVEYGDAQAVRIAVTEADLAIVDLLLQKGRLPPNSIKHVLPLVPQSPPELRYNMTKSLIDTAGQSGLPSSILNPALIKAVDPRYQDIDNGLADLLITAGASVDYQQGKCFRLAVEGGSIRLLELLIKNMKDPASLCTAIPVSKRIKEPNVRRRFISLLLVSGAKGSDVDQALVDVLEEASIDEELILLLLAKADVKYHGGKALSTATRYSSSKIVASILNTSQTDLNSRLAALSILLKPDTKDRLAKLGLLLQAGIDQAGLDMALVQEISGERHPDVIRMLVDRKASCEHDGGKALELAIISHDDTLLEYLVASNPNPLILGKSLNVAMCNTDVTSRRSSAAILLRGGANSSQISHALVQEVRSSRPDPQLINLLLQYGASVDHSNGEAIKFVVSKPLDIELLRILLAGKAASSILLSLVPLAMAHVQNLRLPLLQVLLENGASGFVVDAALVAAVSEGVVAQPTIDLLLQHDASVNFQNAEAIKIASLAGPSSILDRLLSKDPDPDYLTEALSIAMHAPVEQTEPKIPLRLHLVQLLTRKGITNLEVVHSALIQAVQEMDHALVEHLLEIGGDPNFGNGISVVTAARQYDIKSLTALAKSRVNANIYSDAFSAAVQDLDRKHQKPGLILKIDDILLRGGATGAAVDQTFLNALNSTHPLAINFLRMALTHKTPLDVNFQNGKSLCISVKKGLFKTIEYLLLMGPNRDTLRWAFMSIFESDACEENLIMMAHEFFNYSKEAKHIYFEQRDFLNNPLYQTLHRHGDKPDLLQVLLDNGCRADSRFSWIFRPEIGAEETSALLWLLCQGDKSFEGRTVKILLDRGADVDFRTAISGNSPLIVAASSLQSQTVLQLLEAGAQTDTEDEFCGTPLQYATQVGDLKSIGHLLEREANANNESLHIAARHLDVSAVKLLLDHGASIDWPGIRLCNGRTPLGEVCLNADPKNNSTKLKNTLKVLTKAEPDLQKLSDGKSHILLALDNNSPLLMTRKLLEAYSPIQKNINDDFNIYHENGLSYSPTMYVRHFKCATYPRHRSLNPSHRCCNSSTCAAPDLEKLLRAFGCDDRFWDSNGGADQPYGGCGFPDTIIAAKQQAEKTRQEQADKIRRKEEEEAEHAAHQASLDADAEAQLKRDRARLRLKEEQRQAEARAKEALRQEEKRAEQHRLDAEEAAANAKRDTRWREFDEDEKRMELMAEAQAAREKRKGDLKAKQLKEEARIAKDLIKQRTELVESATRFVRHAETSGIGRVAAGRVLGEIEDGHQV